jgi:monooxygenase
MRFINVSLHTLVYNGMERYPQGAKRLLVGEAYTQLKDVMSKEEFKKHFVPPYNPWDQRLCLAPAGDFFQCIRDGKAAVVTGHIDRFTENGILMKDGTHGTSCTVLGFVHSIRSNANLERK